MENNKPVIGVVITSYGSVDPLVYHNHLSNLMCYSKKHQLMVYHINGVQQPVALNMMTKRALDDGCDYIFYLEHDNLIVDNTLDLLLSDAKDIVSGWYTLRRYPFLPIPLVKNAAGTLDRMTFVYKEGCEYLLEAEVGCFGSCLVKTSLLKQLPEDLFSHGYDEKTKTFFTPDIILFEAAKKLGYKVYVDGRVQIGHVGDSIIVTPENYNDVFQFFCHVYPEVVRANELENKNKLIKME
jgi:hypothetical protein